MGIALVQVLRMCGALVSEQHLSKFNWTYQKCMRQNNGYCGECMGPPPPVMRDAWRRIYETMNR